jgi:hypothetical protein
MSGFSGAVIPIRRSQWPRGLRCGSTAARLLGLWVPIPPVHEALSVVIFAFCQVKFSATGQPLVQRSPIEWGVSVCNCGTLWRRPRHREDCRATRKKLFPFFHTFTVFFLLIQRYIFTKWCDLKHKEKFDYLWNSNKLINFGRPEIYVLS